MGRMYRKGATFREFFLSSIDTPRFFTDAHEDAQDCVHIEGDSLWIRVV